MASGPQFIIEANRQSEPVKWGEAVEPAPLTPHAPADRWGCDGGNSYCGQGKVCSNLTWAMGYCRAPSKRARFLMRAVL